MIQVLIKNNFRSSSFVLPTDTSNICYNLYFVRVPDDIQIGDERVELTANKGDELAKRLCKKLLKTDNIFDINFLCYLVDEFRKRNLRKPDVPTLEDLLNETLSKPDVCGINNIYEDVFSRWFGGR